MANRNPNQGMEKLVRKIDKANKNPGRPKGKIYREDGDDAHFVSARKGKARSKPGRR